MRAATALAVEGFAPVALAELQLRAPALTRVDRKYAVARESVPDLLAEVSGLVERGCDINVLEIDGAREFRYRSTYYDTVDLLAFRAAGQRRRRRFTVRTRSYIDAGSRFVEVKTRGPRGMSVKEREALHAERALSGPAADFVDSRLAGIGIPPVADRLHPTLTTAYRRTTLVHNAHRVTIDTDLHWALEQGRPGPTGAECSLDALAIVETKAGSSPTVFDRLLWRRGIRPVRLSKYGTGMLLLRPDLPHLKWHRALSRHLSPAFDDRSCTP